MDIGINMAFVSGDKAGLFAWQMQREERVSYGVKGAMTALVRVPARGLHRVPAALPILGPRPPRAGENDHARGPCTGNRLQAHRRPKFIYLPYHVPLMPTSICTGSL